MNDQLTTNLAKPETRTALNISKLQLTINKILILNGVNITLPAGHISGLVGESGSGKSMTGLAVCGLLPEGSQTTGEIEFVNSQIRVPNLLNLSPKKMNELRGSQIGLVAQDPTASLHPMLTIGTQLTDHVRLHLGLNRAQALTHAITLLHRVQIPNPKTAITRYPHQFSGGQLQRIAIAIAIACNPTVLIADEPTTALDVTVQAEILRLIRDLCDELKLAVLFITHDLGVMSAIADTITVMRHGLVVESGSRQQIIQNPQTEYARELIESLPQVPPSGMAAAN